jgi:DNA-binding transcriptional regulator YiaG
MAMAVKTEKQAAVKQTRNKPVVTAGKPASNAKTALQPTKPLAANFSSLVLRTRKSLGVTQSVFGRLIGVSERSISAWELGKPINQASLRRVKEVSRLAEALERSMKKSYIPTWLVTPNEGLAGISPLEALDRGENDRLWRTVFYLGSGAPI